MTKNLPALLSLMLVAGLASANTYVVTNLSDSGAGSLRAALGDAATNAGKDTVTFKKSLSGGTIEPESDLYVGDGTVLDGDLSNDGAPDIALSGAKRSSGLAGLILNSNDCVLDGMALVGFSAPGLAGAMVSYVSNCIVRSCYFGVALDGTTKVANGYDLLMFGPTGCTIGQPGKGNVFAAWGLAIEMRPGQGNVIQNNRFGTTADGNTALGAGWLGVSLEGMYGETSGNIVRNNVFGGLQIGISMYNTHGNVITGNLFGVGADGNTALPLTAQGVSVGDSCTANRIGGATLATRNVFVGTPTAVGVLLDATTTTTGNTITGNYFGTNAAGDAQLTLGIGISLPAGYYGGAGSQTIGGSTPASGNYFAPGGTTDAIGCSLDPGGSGSTIRNNRFGVLPNGTPVPPLKAGIIVHGATGVRIQDNLVSRGTRGIDVEDGAVADVYNNTFRACERAVYLSGTGIARLGNLRNASTADDGGNWFRANNTWFIDNQTASRVLAEGNSFDTTSKAAIDARIWDKLDSAALGRVDFIPLTGGILPSGGAEAAGSLTVTGAAAVPTAGGAEVFFTLSAPADVTVEVVNIAGRPVARLAQERTSEAGLQRLMWNGQSLSGTAAPAGRYLIRVTAHAADGTESTALATVSVR